MEYLLVVLWEKKNLFHCVYHPLKNSNSLYNTYLPWRYILQDALSQSLPNTHKISGLWLGRSHWLSASYLQCQHGNEFTVAVKLKNRNCICYVQPYNMKQKKAKLKIRTKINMLSAKAGHQLRCTQNWPYQSKAIGHSSYTVYHDLPKTCTDLQEQTK